MTEAALVDEARLAAAERRLNALIDHWNVKRVRQALLDRQVIGAVLKRVPSHYYSLPLQARAELVGAASVSQLCKTIVLENVAHEDGDGPKFLALVVQYEAKIDFDALESKVQQQQQQQQQQRRKKVKFQLAPESVSEAMTGFIHNAVTPFGMKTAVPLVVCQRVLDCPVPFIFLGGGEIDMKLGISTADLMRATGATNLGYVTTLSH